MLAHWKHLDLGQRRSIANMLAQGWALKRIAAAIGMDPTSISKEIKRNRTQCQPAPPERELDFYLSTECSRTADGGSTFGLFGKRMMLFDENMLPARATPHLPLTLYVTRSRKVVGVWKGKVYAAMEAPKAESSVPEKKPGRPRYIPPKDSPWRKFVINPKKSGNK